MDKEQMRIFFADITMCDTVSTGNIYKLPGLNVFIFPTSSYILLEDDHPFHQKIEQIHCIAIVRGFAHLPYNHLPLEVQRNLSKELGTKTFNQTFSADIQACCGNHDTRMRWLKLNYGHLVSSDFRGDNCHVNLSLLYRIRDVNLVLNECRFAYSLSQKNDSTSVRSQIPMNH